MNKEELSILNKILKLIEEHIQEYPQHLNSCDFLKSKYTDLRNAIINLEEKKQELIHWSIWFAPRIIYDGINDKKLLDKVEELNNILSNE